MEQINQYEGLYEIHLNGPNGQPAVWSCISNRYLKDVIDNWGYHRVTLVKDKKKKAHKIHRLVAEYFINNDDEHINIDHINGDKNDNRVQNLRWISQSGNAHNRLGVKGYSWCKISKKWRVNIKVNYTTHTIGFYDSIEEARQAYLDASNKYFPNILL